MLDSAVMRMAEIETMEKSGHPLQGQKELDAELVLTSFLLLSAHLWMADGDCLSHGPSLLSPPRGLRKPNPVPRVFGDSHL